jgi:Ca2+:H+ antiporter
VQTALAVALFVVPAAAHGWDPDDSRAMVGLTAPVAGVLLLLYVVVTGIGVVRQRRAHIAHRAQGGAEPAAGGWSFARSITTLALAALATAFVSEILTGSVEEFSRAAGLEEFFVAAVIVALVGNAAEHGGAVVIAARGNVELAAEIPLSSGAQVALFVIPVVVLVSYAINPLPLAFRPVELLTMAAAVVFPAIVAARGRASRPLGAMLCCTYAAVAAGYYLAA